MSVATVPEEMTLQVDMELPIKASASKVFAALIRQLTTEFGPPEHPMNLTLEAWPGGRWFRDLGDKQGHFWGHVQVIKPPSLLEVTGPLFMSYPAISHLQYRLVAQGHGTRLTLNHRAIGEIAPEHREGVAKGWEHMLATMKAIAEKKN
jgi:uncharacterized protein YndB with AHSA1/START domain